MHLVGREEEHAARAYLVRLEVDDVRPPAGGEPQHGVEPVRVHRFLHLRVDSRRLVEGRHVAIERASRPVAELVMQMFCPLHFSDRSFVTMVHNFRFARKSRTNLRNDDGKTLFPCILSENYGNLSRFFLANAGIAP